ncbi:MAG: metal-dependent transcriptional regulator [Firmicutes bacterium]|nr:metal-dependent transcriptional regulator [Bacillota bacterium]
MSVTHNIGKTEKAEMYLKAILLIGYENPPVTVTKVAEFLGVSAASVSEMMKRMEANDLVTVTGAGIVLTPAGLQDARRLVRRMRLAERLLSDVLGLPLANVYEEACRLEHAISDAVEERIAAVLGDPDTCPHGHPIPSAAGRVDCPLAESLSQFGPGDRATVVNVPERDPDLLRYLEGFGIRPGVEVLVEDVAPYNGPFFLRIGDRRQAVAREALEQVRVIPLPD